MNRKLLCAFLTFVSLLVCMGVSVRPHAQTYPAKPIRVINPSAPGGSNDIVARLLVKTMTAELGQSVYVDNKPGAGGNIGTELVAKAPADGYTLLMVTNSHAINASMHKDLRYDPVNDFDHLGRITDVPMTLVSIQITPERWLIQFPPKGWSFGGRGRPSTRFAMLHLPGALAGKPLPKRLQFEVKPDGGWRLENTRTGETLEGFLAP